MQNQRIRLAILYSDGTIGVLRPGTSREEADRQKAFADAGETDPAHRCGLATVDIQVTETLVAIGEG